MKLLFPGFGGTAMDTGQSKKNPLNCFFYNTSIEAVNVQM